MSDPFTEVTSTQYPQGAYFLKTVLLVPSSTSLAGALQTLSLGLDPALICPRSVSNLDLGPNC